VDLNAMITRTMELLMPSLRVDNIAVHLHLAAPLPPLWADSHQLQQVVVNLVTNAQQALRDTTGSRQLTLKTWYDPSHPGIIFEVIDTGPGIPLALQGRIFEPFFTTKPPGVGTGLGLSLCRGLLEGHGATISVISVPGQGARFRVELPTAGALEATTVLLEPEVPPLAGGQTILVVDDEPGLARGLARLLRRDGYNVDIVDNGRLALAQIQERAYDLILSDLRLPELDGTGLFRALIQQYPHLLHRFVFITGDTLSPETLTFFAQHGVPRLIKPFTVAEVRRVVQQALDTA
jgi:CheY-like chemotaxis protein